MEALLYILINDNKPKGGSMIKVAIIVIAAVLVMGLLKRVLMKHYEK
jgi:hypothetical protein